MLYKKDKRGGNWVIKVGLASCGIAAGGRKVYDAFSSELRDRGLDVELKQTGCMGMCYNEVLVEVSSPEDEHVFYGHVTPDQVERIVVEHLIGGKSVAEWVIPADEIADLLAKQRRIVLRNCGIIDPESIDDYVDTGGYQGIQKVLHSMSPQEVTRSLYQRASSAQRLRSEMW